MLTRTNRLLPLYQETSSYVADFSSLSDYHVLDRLEAHDDTASQWTEDT